jgi:hypothetical protein
MEWQIFTTFNLSLGILTASSPAYYIIKILSPPKVAGKNKKRVARVRYPLFIIAAKT